MALFKAREILYTNVSHLPHWLKNIIRVQRLLKKLARKNVGLAVNVEHVNRLLLINARRDIAEGDNLGQSEQV